MKDFRDRVVDTWRPQDGHTFEASTRVLVDRELSGGTTRRQGNNVREPRASHQQQLCSQIWSAMLGFPLRGLIMSSTNFAEVSSAVRFSLS
jgi:hypothetical protein